MRGWIFPALLVAALALPAQAQQEQKWTQGNPPKTQVRVARGSPVAKIYFAQPALVLDDDGTYAETIRKVGKEVSRECGAVESYGWDFRGKDRELAQQQATAIFQSTMQELEKAGYKLTEKKVRSIPDPETLAFTADRPENRLVLLWSPVQDATLLLICDAGAGAKSAPAKPQGKK